MKAELTIEQKRAIYKRLEEKSPLEVGVEFGLHKIYPNKNGLRTFIYGVRKEVEKDPVKFVVDSETVARVKAKAEERAVIKPQPNLPDTTQDIKDIRMIDLTESISKRSAFHLNKILSKKNLNLPVTQLAMVMGIALDKWLLLSGKSTENIAFKAKIDINLSSETLLKQLLELREAQK